MRSSVGALLAMAMVLTLASIAFARGAPHKKAFTDQAIVSVHVAPTVAEVPQTTGFDVILNLSTAYSRLASVNQSVDTSATSRQSSTVDWRSTNVNQSGSYSARSGPHAAIVLLA